MSDFEIVDRPTIKPAALPEHQALLDTLTSGKAISVPLNGESIEKMRQRMISVARYRGLRLRTRTVRDCIIAWVEHKEKREPEPPK